jgi:proline iminopeptidase
MLYAVEYPDDVSLLALVAPAPASAEGRQSYRERFAARSASPAIAKQREELERSGLPETDPAAYRKRAFELSLLPYFHEVQNAHHVAPFIVSAQVRDAVWRSLGDYDLLGRLGGGGVRCLVLHGRHDPTPIESSEQIAIALDAQLEIFEHSGHLPFVEEPDRFVEILDAFLPKEQS